MIARTGTRKENITPVEHRAPYIIYSMSSIAPASSAPKVGFPSCIKNNEARMVCLNPSCQQYPFFCTLCEEEECEVIHHHGDKLSSMGFKEYLKKVLKDKKVDGQLEDALRKYEECLEKLRRDIQEFVQRQLKETQQIRKRAIEMEEEEQQTLIKLRNEDYKSLKGYKLDQLWQKSMEFEQGGKQNLQTIEFLQMKEDEIKEISHNFETLNNLEVEGFEAQSAKKQDQGPMLQHHPKSSKEENQQPHTPKQEDKKT